MERKLIRTDIDAFPREFHTLIRDSSVFDSSCSPEAKVYFIDKDEGYFLKCSSKDSLRKEAELTRYFHSKGLGAEVLSYVSDENDWFLTKRVQGEDCTFAMYLEDPKKLCDTTATLLRMLHETDFSNCPVENRTADYLSTVENNYRSGTYDSSHFPDSFGYASTKEAWAVIEKDGKYLKTDTLLHGDYCLPNTILDNWRFSGFIDLGCGGVGDRHIDLFWGAWTLFYNLKTDCYRDRFFDVYGRDLINEDVFRIIAAAEVFG